MLNCNMFKNTLCDIIENIANCTYCTITLMFSDIKLPILIKGIDIYTNKSYIIVKKWIHYQISMIISEK